MDIQKKFLEQIIAKYPKKSEAVDGIGRLLDMGKDAVYRRLRGVSDLSIEQLSTLAKFYSLSLDTIIHNREDTFIFNYNIYTDPINSFSDYLKGVKKNFKIIRDYSEAKFYYTTFEIPVFYYCFFPEIISFKLYIWGRSIWNFEYLKDRPFEFQMVSPDDLELSEEILNTYLQIPSIELWSLALMDNTLNQIEYHLNSGSFKDPQDALVLCEKLVELTKHMRLMAQYGQKYRLNSKPDENSTTFDLYHNEMVYTNNTILAVTNEGKGIFTSFCNPNFLMGKDQNLCDYTEYWFERLIAKANPISKHAEKNRAWFFNGLLQKISFSKTKISAQVDLLKL